MLRWTSSSATPNAKHWRNTRKGVGRIGIPTLMMPATLPLPKDRAVYDILAVALTAFILLTLIAIVGEVRDRRYSR